MSKLPHYPWYPDDYLASPWVMACDLADEGIYRRLLDQQWKHPGCQLPDKPDYLRKLCKNAKWIKILAVLECNFVKIEMGNGIFFWRNLRIYSEFCKISALSEQQRDKANLRWEKEKQNATAMQKHMPKRCPPDPEPYPEPEESKKEAGSQSEPLKQPSPENGEVLKPATEKSRRRKKSEMSDEEWLAMVKANPAYRGIDVDLVQAKLIAWCATKGKQPTRSRLLNWLNREERPLGGGNGTGQGKRSENNRTGAKGTSGKAGEGQAVSGKYAGIGEELIT